MLCGTSIAATFVSTNSDSAVAAARGSLMTCSYRNVVSWSAPRALRSLAILCTDPRQRIAHRPAAESVSHAARSTSVSMP
jgi:hypothetical protein